MYRIIEVDGTDEAETIRRFNAMEPDWPPISDNHLRGYWWIIYSDFGFGRPVGFAGMVPFFEPSDGIGYLKRCYLEPEARGNGLQIRALFIREALAKKIGWRKLVSETTNVQSAGNFIKAGYSPFEPEQRWGAEGSMYFVKAL